jgi:hypothetical protein
MVISLQNANNHPIQGILRETQISQFYRYAKISHILEAGQFCRYVGVIATFLVRRYFGFPDDIHNYLRFFKYSRHPQ